MPVPGAVRPCSTLCAHELCERLKVVNTFAARFMAAVIGTGKSNPHIPQVQRRTSARRSQSRSRCHRPQSTGAWRDRTECRHTIRRSLVCSRMIGEIQVQRSTDSMSDVFTTSCTSRAITRRRRAVRRSGHPHLNYLAVMLSFVLSPCVGPSAECGVVAVDDGNGDGQFEVVEHGDAASTTGLAQKGRARGRCT